MSQQISNRDLAYSLVSYLTTLAAQWADVEAAARPHPDAHAALHVFGERMAEFEKAVRTAAGRLDEDCDPDAKLCPQCRNPMVQIEADPAAKTPAMRLCTHAACDYCEMEETPGEAKAG